jgi:hypothetical protein
MALRPRSGGWRGNNGSALVLAQVVSGVVAALGGVVLTAAILERAASSASESGEQTWLAAEALAERVLAEIADADWSAVLSGSVVSSFHEGSVVVPAPWGQTIDLAAARGTLQADTTRVWRLGPNTPIWQLYASGSLLALIADGLPVAPRHVAGWVADDAGEVDGDPRVDSNGRIAVRVEARGPSSETRAIQILVARAFGDVSAPSAGAGGPVPERFQRHAPAGSVQSTLGRLEILGWREER